MHDLPGLSEVDADAEAVPFDWRTACCLRDVLVATGDAFRWGAREGGLFQVDRDPARVDCAMPRPMSPAAIVHPGLTLPLAVLSYWRGRAVLHAGAVEVEGRAYALCGERGTGKSSTLAALARLGLPVVADDLVAVQDGEVLAGPSCVDLRADGAAAFPGTEDLGVVGERARFRLRTPASAPRVPLAGICLLEWADDATSAPTPLGLGERLDLLRRHHYAPGLGPPHHGQTLDLLEVPMWRFRRPRDWGAAQAGLDQLLAAFASA